MCRACPSGASTIYLSSATRELSQKWAAEDRVHAETR